MPAEVIIFAALVVFQLAANGTFLGLYLRDGWPDTPAGRHLVYWPVASAAVDLSWLLLLIVRWPWLIYALFAAQFVVGLATWWRAVLVWRAQHPRRPMYEYGAIVRRVVDGDTIVVDLDMGRGLWVLKARHRLNGCNARGLNEPGGPEAMGNLKLLIPEDCRVILRSFRPYKYGGSDEAAEYMADIIAGPFLPPGVTSLVAHLIATHWAAPWDGRGPAPVPPWPRPEEASGGA